MNHPSKESKMETALGIIFDKLFIYNVLMPLIVFGGIWLTVLYNLPTRVNIWFLLLKRTTPVQCSLF